MKQKIKRWFFPWQYAEELRTVNERSEDGCHLVAATMSCRTEEVDDSVVYRYALDCKENQNFTEMLYEKQGWELVCTQGKWLWFRKEWSEDRQESEYEIHGEERHAIADHLHRLIAPLDKIRNLILIPTFVAMLIPPEMTNNLTPRLAGFILLLALPPVWFAEKMRKALGEDKRK